MWPIWGVYGEIRLAVAVRFAGRVGHTVFEQTKMFSLRRRCSPVATIVGIPQFLIEEWILWNPTVQRPVRKLQACLNE